MTDKETIKNLTIRLTTLSNVMVAMFKVVAVHMPATNEQFKSLVGKWENLENKYPLPEPEETKNDS